MENSNQIANRFRAVLLNGRWIAGTNYRYLLSDVTWKEATTPIGSFNTIASLTYHINYYIAGVLNVFEGGTLDIRDKYSFDLPPITSKEDWEKVLNTLWTNAENFALQVDKLSAEKLSSNFAGEKYGDYRRNIEGIIEHSYYHLGQISLIKKMIREHKKQ